MKQADKKKKKSSYKKELSFTYEFMIAHLKLAYKKELKASWIIHLATYESYQSWGGVLITDDL